MRGLSRRGEALSHVSERGQAIQRLSDYATFGSSLAWEAVRPDPRDVQLLVNAFRDYRDERNALKREVDALKSNQRAKENHGQHEQEAQDAGASSRGRALDIGDDQGSDHAAGAARQAHPRGGAPQSPAQRQEERMTESPNCREANQPWHTWCKSCKRKYSEFEEFPQDYEPGVQVVVSTVDMEGLQGRDPHPEEQHIGMSGLVLSFVDRDFNLGDSGPIDFYLVQLETFEQFQFADYELEPAPRVGTANESKPATLGVAGNPQNEPTGEPSMNAQIRSVRELLKEGWQVDNIYEDGVVSMVKLYDNDYVKVGIMPTGVISEPRTDATTVAEAEIQRLMNELGGERRVRPNGWIPPWS